MKKMIFFIYLLCFAFSVSAQTKSVEIAKVNQSNWRVVEFIDLNSGETESVVFSLRDSRFTHIFETFYISFDDRESIIDFLQELSKLLDHNESGIHSTIYGYHITTGKIMGGSFLIINDNKSNAYSHLDKIYFKNLCKALKKKGYNIDFI